MTFVLKARSRAVEHSYEGTYYCFNATNRELERRENAGLNEFFPISERGKGRTNEMNVRRVKIGFREESSFGDVKRRVSSH